MGPNFIQKKIASEKTLGEILRKHREEAGLTLEAVSRKTKIRRTYLQALEENDYQSLPYEPYATGILKKYSEFLGLHQKKILEFYARQKGIDQHVRGKNQPKIVRPLKNPRFVITPKTYFIILTVLAFLCVLVYIIYQYKVFATPPELNINYPPDNITLENNSIAIEGKTSSNADLLINDQNISIEKDGTFKSLVNLQNGINYIKITTKNRINKEKTIVRKVMARIPENNSKQNQQTVKSLLELIVQINPNSAWLYIEADNKQIYQGIMLPGTRQIFQANDYISLTTRNGGSVEVLFNGKNLGKLGAEGEVIKGLKFDRNTKVN